MLELCGWKAALQKGCCSSWWTTSCVWNIAFVAKGASGVQGSFGRDFVSRLREVILLYSAQVRPWNLWYRRELELLEGATKIKWLKQLWFKKGLRKLELLGLKKRLRTGSRCTNIWREDVKEMETDSFQWCQGTGQDGMGRNENTRGFSSTWWNLVTLRVTEHWHRLPTVVLE